VNTIDIGFLTFLQTINGHPELVSVSDQTTDAETKVIMLFQKLTIWKYGHC